MNIIGKIEQSFALRAQSVFKAINRSVHKELMKDRELRYRARMLLFFVYVFLCLFTSLAIGLLFSPLDLKAKILGMGIWLFLTIALLLIDYLVRVVGSFWIAGHLLLTTITVITYFGISVTGGPSISPVTELVLFFPLICFYLTGLRVGLVWSLINIILLVLMFVLDALNYDFFNAIPEQFFIIISGIIYVSGFISLFLMVTIYENTLVGLQEQQQKSQAQVRHLANHDKLTGIANRAYFYQRLEAAILKHKSSKGKEMLALLYMDLVGFNEINDNHGHHTGDIVLQSIAKNLEEGVRGTDLVARHGGDEFVVLLNRVKDEEALFGIADKVAELVSQTVDVVGLQLQVFPSMGIACLPLHAKDANDLERCADRAMYEAKQEKKLWKMYQGSFSEAGTDRKFPG